jgi:hypothetical protein
MQAQKLDYALLALLGTSRDPRTDRPLYLTDAISVDVEFKGGPTEDDRLAVARLGGACRAERADMLTIVAPALSMAPLTDLPRVAKVHFGGRPSKVRAF